MLPHGRLYGLGRPGQSLPLNRRHTSPRGFTYGPTDERAGRSPWDAQKSSGNTNDLRGKIIRIKPNKDGTYSIPEGNLFPPGTPLTKPEIYVMGTRNPYRISLDKKTGFLYWGEVGPDASKDSLTLGSRGYDEVNQAKKAGYFGWPYFVGDNQPYVRYDFASGESFESYLPAKPVNNSPNNTGLKDLPPAQKAFIWYPYAKSEQFPLVGSGARNAMAGPVFYSSDFRGAERPFPDYYNGKLFIYDWMRGWIMAVTMDPNGDYLSMEPFLASHKFSNPIDMELAANGDLYLLKYGAGWFQGNEDARLVRIEYNGGNRPPQVQLACDKQKGATPLAAHFSSRGTFDFDNDPLAYSWAITGPDGKTLTQSTGPDFAYTFEKPGIYRVALTVNDGKGGKSTANMEVVAGNEPPKLEIDFVKGNSAFFFPGGTFEYRVRVEDKEDGSLANGGISPEAVSFSIDYLPEGYDKTMIASGHKFADELAVGSRGKALIEKSDCVACHALNKKSIGPSYTEIAQKYSSDPKAVAYLAQKIKQGGSGAWGNVAMAAHPDLPQADVEDMARYILSIGKDKSANLPLEGKYLTAIPKGQSYQGVYILRAAYQDKGAQGMPGIRTEKVMLLRNASINASACDNFGEIQKVNLPDQGLELMIARKDGAFIGFEGVDLSGIGAMSVLLSALGAYCMIGGAVEVRLGSPTGELLGVSAPIKPSFAEGTQGMPSPSVAVIPLRPASGRQNIYLVAKNPDSDGSQMLFVFMRVMFQGGGKSL